MHVFAECKNFDTVRDTVLDIFHLSKNWWEAFIKLTEVSKKGKKKEKKKKKEKGKTQLHVRVPQFTLPEQEEHETDEKYQERVQEKRQEHDAT